MKTRLSLTFLISSSALLIFGAQLFGQTHFWVGDSLTTSNWNDTANWQGGTTPSNGDPLVFQGSNRTTNTNDLPTADLDSIVFGPTAAAFTLQGKTMGLLSNGITNNSVNLQTINLSQANANLVGYSGLVLYEPSTTWTAAAGPLSILCSVQAGRVNVTGPSTLTITGGFDTAISGSMTDDPTIVANTLVLVKNGSGTLTLSGDNHYTGGTTINSGTLVAGSLHALAFGNVILNGGVLQTDTPRLFEVHPNYTQNGGTLRLQIGSATTGINNDLMDIQGAANLSGQLFIHQFGGFTPVNGNQVTVINTGSGVNGTFSSVADDFPGLIRAVPVYFSNRVDIMFQIIPFSSLSGLTPNQKAVAKNLDDAANDPAAAPLIDFLNNELLGNLPHDYDLIAPEELAVIYEIGFAQAVVQNNNLQRRMDDIRAGANGFCPDVLAPQVSGKDYSKDGKASLSDRSTAVVPTPENRWGTFVTGSGNFVNVGDDDFNAHGYDIATGHFTLGADYRVSEHFAVGIDGGYSASTADLVNDGRVEVDGGKIGAYATVYGNGLFGSKSHVDAAVSGGWNNYDTRRTGLQDLPVRGSTNGSEFNSFISYGADWTFGCLNLGTWSSLQYTNVSIDSFTEDGSLAPLQFQDQDEDSVRATTGIRASYDIKSGHTIIRPEVRGAYLHEYNNRSYPIDASLASGAGNVFRVRGPEIGRNAALVGAGVNIQWCPRFSTYVYYDGVLGRENYSNNAVSAGAHVSF